jgi:hypothetical protein
MDKYQLKQPVIEAWYDGVYEGHSVVTIQAPDGELCWMHAYTFEKLFELAA